MALVTYDACEALCDALGQLFAEVVCDDGDEVGGGALVGRKEGLHL